MNKIYGHVGFGSNCIYGIAMRLDSVVETNAEGDIGYVFSVGDPSEL